MNKLKGVNFRLFKKEAFSRIKILNKICYEEIVEFSIGLKPTEKLGLKKKMRVKIQYDEKNCILKLQKTFKNDANGYVLTRKTKFSNNTLLKLKIRLNFTNPQKKWFKYTHSAKYRIYKKSILIYLK